MLFQSRLTVGERKPAILRFPFDWPRSLVNPDGSCSGLAKMTLVYSPPLDPAFGAESQPHYDTVLPHGVSGSVTVGGFAVPLAADGTALPVALDAEGYIVWGYGSKTTVPCVFYPFTGDGGGLAMLEARAAPRRAPAE